jgi:hypothetical protein
MRGKKSKRHDWEKYLELAAEAGSLAMSLRDRPTRLDWVAVALRGISLVFRVRAEARARVSSSPWDYFRCDGMEPEWVLLPESLRELVIRHVRDAEILPTHWDGQINSVSVVIGKLLGREEVGWISQPDDVIAEGPYVRSDRQGETLSALGACMWRSFGGRHLLFGTDGISVDLYADDEHQPTSQFRSVFKRLECFANRRVSRSVLFAGPPGTGKSCGIRYLARALGAPSLRVELTALSRTFEQRRMSPLLGSVELIVKALHPEILIVDDIDRVADEAELLHFLELAGRLCRVVLASANCTRVLTGALLRPGRFDELIEVDRPDPDIVRAIVGDNRDLVSRLEDLPIAYIAEFVKRRDSLGLDCALDELDELKARRKRAEEGR